MNRIVREHYPVSQLPEDLRKEFVGSASVRITIDSEPAEINKRLGSSEILTRPAELKTLDELYAIAKPMFRSFDEINAYVLELRREWD